MIEGTVFDNVRALVLRWLRVPPEPEPPFGEARSLRVFRASRKLYYLRLIGWSLAQVAALAGILFWMTTLLVSEREANRARTEAAEQGLKAPRLKPGRNRPLSQGFKDISARVPQAVFVFLWVAKGLGLCIYLLQMAVTYCAVRLDYEMRWYLVTDRSLRIRSGLWKVQELTMSFCNLQQVVVSEGPLQRLLGIADVRVQSAGGGGGSGEGSKGSGASMHTGVFHGVENAAEIRDLILDRLRQFRETGLGDPDEAHAVTVGRNTEASTALVLSAARELLAEARQLRRVTESPEFGD